MKVCFGYLFVNSSELHHRRRARARTSPPPKKKNLTAGARGTTEFTGHLSKIKRLMKKPNIQQRKCVIPWQRTHCHSSIQQLCRSHCVLCRRRQQLDTAVLQFVDILYRSLVNAILNQPLYFVVDWIQVWYTRVDGRKYLNTF